MEIENIVAVIITHVWLFYKIFSQPTLHSIICFKTRSYEGRRMHIYTALNIHDTSKKDDFKLVLKIRFPFFQINIQRVYISDIES